MTSLDTYRALLARVEAATGADRELDDRIAMRVAGLRPAITLGDEVLGNLRDVPAHSPRYTASLDVALALVERALPGWYRQFFERADGKGWIVRLKRSGTPTHAFAQINVGDDARGFPTPALALLAALLTALIAQEDPQP